MATWHQQRNPVNFWHETLWTVVHDPPNECTSLARFNSKAEAEQYMQNLKNLNKAEHHFIVAPARKDIGDL